MTSRTWNFSLDGTEHTLALAGRLFSKQITPRLDGRALAPLQREGWASASIHPIKLGRHSLQVVIQPRFPGTLTELLVDGISLDTGARGPRRVLTPLRQAALVFFALVILLVVAISLLAKSDYDQKVVIQREWAVVTGKISAQEASYHVESGDEDTSDREYYFPLLTITYTINDRSYSIQIEDGSKSYDTQRQALAAYEVGGNQRLYVNPKKAEEAVLFFEKLNPGEWITTIAIVDSVFIAVAAFFIGIVWLLTKGKPYALEAKG